MKLPKTDKTQEKYDWYFLAHNSNLFKVFLFDRWACIGNHELPIISPKWVLDLAIIKAVFATTPMNGSILHRRTV